MEVFLKILIGLNQEILKTLEIKWPIPKQFEILGMKSIGYANKVIFPLKIRF